MILFTTENDPMFYTFSYFVYDISVCMPQDYLSLQCNDPMFYTFSYFVYVISVCMPQDYLSLQCYLML
jgi:hypothetical protein